MELNFFGANARFHHIGMAVHDIHELNQELETWLDPIQKVKVGFVNFNGLPVEFVSPINCGASPIDQSLKKGNKLIHICFEVPDLHSALEACRAHGFRQVALAVPAVAFNNRKISWVFSNSYGLFELLESTQSA